MKLKLNSWFEIDESQYIWYILQGYTIDVNKDRVKWIMDGKPHREDGPALIHADGAQEWYVDGKRHREDGPAVICADGTQVWFLNGASYTEDEFNEKYFGVN